MLFGTGQFYPYPSGLLHWHWGNHTIAPVPVKQPWRIWVYIYIYIHITWIHNELAIWPDCPQQNKAQQTFGCCYNAAQYRMILNTSWQWLGQNIYQSLNLQKTRINWQSIGCLLWRFGREMILLQGHHTVLRYILHLMLFVIWDEHHIQVTFLYASNAYE